MIYSLLMSDELITIAHYTSPVDASMAKMCLQQEGIPGFVQDENTSSMQMFGVVGASSVRLQVMKKDVDVAKELLDQSMNDGEELLEQLEASGAFDDDSEENQESDSCPRCGSTQLESHRELTPIATVFSFLLLGLPLLFGKRRLKCRKCGHKL